MERRSLRETKRPKSLQKKVAETRHRAEPAPDLTDFMNDMFFGAVEKKKYDLTGGGSVVVEVDEDDCFDDSTRSNSARLTQEWLQEARRIVALSPTRSESPTRLSGSPRFVAAQSAAGGGSPLAQSLDRRNDLSRARSARRLRGGEGISNDILTKTAKHSRNKSEPFITDTKASDHEGDGSPAAAVHKWFSNILKPNNDTPQRQPLPRKSRFNTLNTPDSPSRLSSESLSLSLPLSPPRNLLESAHRRTISSSTCSLEKPQSHVAKAEEATQDHRHSLNGFLREQRALFHKISHGELNAKIVLSGPSNSTASMVAAICHAWLLAYRQREKDGGGGSLVVVPLMNVKRASMWKLKQAAWLFHHAALDATALLFSDEVDMETLLVTGQLSVLVVGQDVLNTSGEVGSQCTILTDNYCEDAYDLLQNSVLKKLLLAGILLDTQNLKASASISLTRDAEAVQLLLVGSAPNYRYALFDQLMQDQKSTSFIETLSLNYGNPCDESDQNREGNIEHKVRHGRKSSSTISDRETVMSSPKTNSSGTKSAKTNVVSPKPAKLFSPPLQSHTPPPAPAHAEKEASRGKNTFFLARWFGFGPK